MVGPMIVAPSPKRIAGSLLLGASLWTHPAFAQDAAAQAAVRRSMIERAQAAHTAGRHAECAELALRATSIQDTGSLRRLVAECQLGAGAVVEALGNAELCITMLRRDERAAGREQHLDVCTRTSAEARARTTILTVRTPTPEPQGLRVTIGSRALPRVEWNIGTIVPLGALVIEAATDDGRSFRRELTTTSGTPSEVRIEFAPPTTTTQTTNSTSANQTASNTSSTNRAPIETPPPRVVQPPPRRVSPLVIAGASVLGAGAIAAGVGFGVAAAAVAEYEPRCGARAPSPDFVRCAEEARVNQGALDAWATVGWVGVGLATVGAGLVVYGLVRKEPSTELPRARVFVVPTVASGYQGAVLAARF